MQRRPLVHINGTVHELPVGDVPLPFTQTMLDFLSHCSVSPTGQPLWDGLPWGGVSLDYVLTGYVNDGYVE